MKGLDTLLCDHDASSGFSNFEPQNPQPSSSSADGAAFKSINSFDQSVFLNGMNREHHRSEEQSRLEGELSSSDASQIQLKIADKFSPSASPQNQDEVDKLNQLLEALAKTLVLDDSTAEALSRGAEAILVREPDEVQYDGDSKLKKREQMGRIRCIGIQAAAEGRRRNALDEEKREGRSTTPVAKRQGSSCYRVLLQHCRRIRSRGRRGSRRALPEAAGDVKGARG